MLFGGFGLIGFVALVVALVIAISVHEFAHALAADWLGDPTPRSQGRLTLDPRRHLDPLGSIMLLVAGFGWGRPVYTNPYYYRTSARTGMALVAAAGPLSNLVLAMLAAFPIKQGLLTRGTASEQMIMLFINLNVVLLIFNLIPVSPLDGFKVALGFLPEEWATYLVRLEPYGPMILMLLIIGGQFGYNLLGSFINPIRSVVMGLLLGF